MAEGLQVLVVRHGIAEDREAATRAGIPDAGRALTERGLRRLRQAVAGLRTLESRLDAIAHSPLRRAEETAQELRAGYPGAELQRLPALAPGGDPAAVLEWAAGQGASAPVAVVGHEPDLGEWLAWALFGQPREALPLRKAGMALVQFPQEPAAGRGELRWLLLPRILRRLAK